MQHLGIPSLSLGFGGEGGGGVYHSRYDTFDHYRRFSDPGFKYGVIFGEMAGHVVLRFANADILPYRFSPMAEQMSTYFKEISELTESMRQELNYDEKLHTNNAYVLASDPTESYNPPESKSKVPDINFAPLKNAIANLETSAASYDAAFSTQMKNGITLSGGELKGLNKLLQSADQSLNSEQGLPRRPWYRNQIYAPGTNTGYGVKTLPGVREAIEQQRWKEAGQQISTTAQVINRYADHIDRATKLLK